MILQCSIMYLPLHSNHLLPHVTPYMYSIVMMYVVYSQSDLITSVMQPHVALYSHIRGYILGYMRYEATTVASNQYKGFCILSH